MRKIWLFALAFGGLVLTALVVALASAPPGAALAQTAPTATPPPEFAGEPLPTDRGTLFAGAGVCSGCHTRMVDETGADVSIDAFWRSTMMANAARDPYWQASTRVETLSLPDYQAVIEDKCAACHMPMAHTTVAAEGQPGLALDEGFLSPAHPLHGLAIDGNSCTLCHQIEPDNFGQPESLSGHYLIDLELPTGERVTYSPFEVTPEMAALMQGASGYVPVQSEHVQQAELCATCHTLYTPYVDATGQIAGEFPEQMAYFEWLHSDLAQTTACQGCHMPPAEGAVVTSVTGGPPRSPFAKHVFAGGNAYMMDIFRAFGEEMAVTASSVHFDATRERIIGQLTSAASVALEGAGVANGRLAANVVVTNLAGHKFPTGFPSRRAWLHFSVTDSRGQVIFESGEYTTEGLIVDDDHDADPGLYEPHHKVIIAPEDAQIYQSVMQDSDGNLTTTLLRGAGYAKDNRLLPAGFDKQTARIEITPDALALEDANFTSGGDRVMYSIDVGDAPGPFTVTVELLYQSISYRWVQKLHDYDTAESARFLSYYAAVPNLPVAVASATVTIGG